MTYQAMFDKGVRGMLAEWLSGLTAGGGATATRGLQPNSNVTVFASAARTASVNSADQSNPAGRGLTLVIDVTAITATPSVTFTIKGLDPASGKYYLILASAAIVAVGTTVLRVYPGLVEVANVKANLPMPLVWRLEAVHADADSITYSVGAQYTL